MSFNKHVFIHGSVARAQIWRDAQLLLEWHNLLGDVVRDLKPVCFQVFDPGVAAAAIGVTVDVDAGGLG